MLFQKLFLDITSYTCYSTFKIDSEKNNCLTTRIYPKLRGINAIFTSL